MNLGAGATGNRFILTRPHTHQVREGYMNLQYLIDNSIAIGVIVAWVAALALVIIYKWEDSND